MPSILVELGFISTPEEERYLNTEEGSSTLAKGIYRAFLSYKREHEIRLTGSSRTALPNDDEVTDTEVAQIDSTESENKKPQNTPRTDKLVTEAKTQRPIVVESTTNDSEITFKIEILTTFTSLQFCLIRLPNFNATFRLIFFSLDIFPMAPGS